MITNQKELELAIVEAIEKNVTEVSLTVEEELALEKNGLRYSDKTCIEVEEDFCSWDLILDTDNEQLDDYKIIVIVDCPKYRDEENEEFKKIQVYKNHYDLILEVD